MGGVGQSAAMDGVSPHDAAALNTRRYPPSLLSRIAAAFLFEIEAEQERWFLWIAVAFGTGIALYFAAYVEPPLWMLLVTAGAALLIHRFARRIGLWGLASGFVLAMACGGVMGKLRTEYMRAPVIVRPVSSTMIHGWVELVEPRPTRGQRVTLQVISMDRLPREEWPWRVRVRTTNADAKLVPGMRCGCARHWPAHSHRRYPAISISAATLGSMHSAASGWLVARWWSRKPTPRRRSHSA